ncbi:MAG TPA: bifunctional molybdenum cofactor biosynthesis protein MoaC/MoaB [Salinisphaeraceae bacterium]|nr:bifunctional molybdenum cofactor biosynthesis protein MoaC/MoaB [Salinisphaeraceae bacterium]
MKNVGSKPETLRNAVATAVFQAPKHCLELVASGKSEKGDPAATARVAGILAAKRTDEILPLCHPLPLHSAEVYFDVRDNDVLITAEVATIGPTGVEMEALTAASVAALTLYDMLKPYAEPEELALKSAQLSSKTGGKTQFKRTLPSALPAAVIVRASANNADAVDGTGQAVADYLEHAGFAPVAYTLLAEDDTTAALANAVQKQMANAAALIVTIGGIGIETHDDTVETLAPLIATTVPGIMETARAYGQRRTPYAMASRGIAGFAEDSLLVTLPGSHDGAMESLEAVLPGLVHIFRIRHA